jgi:hypothetical protein
MFKRRVKAAALVQKAWCGIIVPLGLPVVPEVNKQYAALSGVANGSGLAVDGMRNFLNA